MTNENSAETGCDESPAAEHGRPGHEIPVVGLGASAGGLAAFEKFFHHLPVDSGLAFVVVQHLDPSHETMLAELLGQYTRMPVALAEDGVRIEPNRVYVIPPNRQITLCGSSLRVESPSETHGLGMPIDRFFYSLAAGRGARAAGVILSGNGSDGAAGLRAIRETGGFTVVQEPEGAGRDGMPRSAISGGWADLVIEPEQMGKALVDWAWLTCAPASLVPEDGEGFTNGRMNQLFGLLSQEIGHDFSGYKESSLVRRVRRRMAVSRIPVFTDYLQYLETNRAELEALFRDLLIGVTAFFRDKEAFEALESKVVRSHFLPEGEKPRKIRIWVPACSTGEEAYSIAILMEEHCSAVGTNLDYQIFASDLDSRALEIARAGSYPASIAADLSASRLERFFSRQDAGNTCRVNQSIRNKIVFTAHNVLLDPPFSKLDLISCRNLLIYFDAESQKQVFPRFHYALRSHGFLFLGASEAVGNSKGFFDTVDSHAKIFRRLEMPSGFNPILHMSQTSHPGTGNPVPSPKPNPLSEMRAIAEKFLLDAPDRTCLLVNEKGDLLYVHGRSGKYLDQATGEATNNILRSAREGLKIPLAAAFRKSLLSAKGESLRSIPVVTDGDTRFVNLTIHPVEGRATLKGLVCVVLTEQSPPLPIESGRRAEASESDEARRISEMEDEIRALRESLQSAVEEHETTHEELKVANEELQSTNEELQSTNEELETSTEEMQSVNEELVTVNAELESKISELMDANADIKSLLENIQTGIIFLDTELRILRFTDAARKIIDLIPADIGRRISHFVTGLVDVDLHEIASQVLADGKVIEREVRTAGEANPSHMLRALIYRRGEELAGVVITFIDIRSMVLSRIAEQRSQARFHSFFDLGTVGMVMQAASTGFTEVNDRFCRDLGRARDELLGQSWNDLIAADDRGPLDEHLAAMFEGGEKSFTMEQAFTRADGSRLETALRAVSLRDPLTGELVVHATVVDVTDRKIAERELIQMNSLYEELYAAIQTSFVGFDVVDADGHFVFANASYLRMWGYDHAEEVIGTSPSGHCVDPGMSQHISREVDSKGQGDFYFKALRKDGSSFDCHMKVARLDRPGGRRIYHGFSEDVSDRLDMERRLHLSLERLNAAASAGVIGVWDWDIAHGHLYFDSVMNRLYGTAEGTEWSYDRWKEFLHPDDCRNVLDSVRRALRGEEPYEIEYRIIPPDGGVRHIKAKGEVRLGPEGEPVRMIGVNYDVSAEQRKIGLLESTKRKLEDSVARQMRQLEDARVRAEAANLAKDRFLAKMSHELRTPLNGIMGYLQLGIGKERDPVLLGWMERSLEGAQHLASIINDLLDLARIERDELRLVRHVFSPARLASEVVEIMSPACVSKGLECRCRIDPRLAGLRVRGDEVRIRQILLNFCSNALNATMEGGMTLKLQLEGDAAEESEVVNLRFALSDTGRGIEPERLARIFNLMDDERIAGLENSSGLGLGLVISKRLVQAMGGRIGAESVVGEGSVFWFSLRLDRASMASSDEVEEAVESSETLLRREFPGASLLLAEDDPVAAEITKLLTERIGLKMDLAIDGHQAVEMAASGRHALILMDLHMPGLNGTEAAGKIRSMAQGTDVPIIALSANAYEKDRQACLDAGMNDHISKPMNFVETCDKLLYWLRRSGTGTTTR